MDVGLFSRVWPLFFTAEEAFVRIFLRKSFAFFFDFLFDVVTTAALRLLLLVNEDGEGVFISSPKVSQRLIAGGLVLDLDLLLLLGTALLMMMMMKIDLKFENCDQNCEMTIGAQFLKFKNKKEATNLA